MKHSLLTTGIITLTFISFYAEAKKPKAEKEPKAPLTLEQKQVIIAGTAEVMNGILTIAQNPRDKNNIGGSVANMVHGLINIVVAKIGRKTIDFNNADAVQECIDEIYEEFNNEFDEIMRTSTLS